MKIRTSFVSNSSSSSFIIEIVNKSESVCPTCKRSIGGSSLLLSHLKNGRDYCGEDTTINRNKNKLIHNYIDEIQAFDDQIAAYSKHQPDEIKRYNWNSAYTNTYGELLTWAQKEKAQCEQMLKKVQEAEGDVYDIQISYHDDLGNELYKQAIDQGGIREIGG